MIPIKTLKIHIDNHSQISYQTIQTLNKKTKTKKQNSYHKLYQIKNTYNKINALQRIRKLNTKKKRVNTRTWFQIIGETSSSHMCPLFSSSFFFFFFFEEHIFFIFSKSIWFAWNLNNISSNPITYIYIYICVCVCVL